MRVSLSYLAPMALLAVACSAGSGHRATSDDVVTEATDSTTFSNDITALNSPSRKRVKTADVRCRVGNVFNTVSTLERVVTGVNGIVSESVMQNESMGIKDIPYSADSLKRIQLYIPTATVTVRVPAAKLDSVVSMLTSMSTFIESRIMKDEDKTLSYLSNALKNDGPPPIAIQPSKQATTVSVATYQDKKYDAETNRRIANMAILDDVHYATFTVQLYQPQMADQQIIVNPEKVILAGFGTEVLQSLRTGLESFSKLVIILVACWPYLLLLTIGMLIYRKVWRKKVPTPINQL